MPKIHHYHRWQKILSSFISFILLFTAGFFVNMAGIFGSVFADFSAKKDLVAIVVEEELLNHSVLKNQIQRYAQDVQTTLREKQVTILSVDNQTIAVEVADVLERLYLEGDTARGYTYHLDGVILIGDIPKPTLYISETVQIPSLAPYTDFEDKAFFYSPREEQFISSGDEFLPEVWHGVIPRFDALEDLVKYFDENHKYYSGEKTIDRKVFYADTIEESAALNADQMGLYMNTMTYSEDIAYKRYTNKLLSTLLGGFRDSLFKEPTEVEQQLEDMRYAESEKEGACIWGVIPTPDVLYKDNGVDLLSQSPSVPDVFSIFQIQKYLPEYGTVAQSYIRQVSDRAEKSGRWTDEDVQFFAKSITLKDIESREKLRAANEKVKAQLQSFVESEWQVPVEVATVVGQDNGYSLQYQDNVIQGQRAENINHVYECSWLRGSNQSSANLSQMTETDLSKGIETNAYSGVVEKGAVSYKNCQNVNLDSDENLDLATKRFSSLFVHDEPNDATIAKHIQLKYLPRLPVDAIPYLNFQDKDLSLRELEFPNFFQTQETAAGFLESQTKALQEIQKQVLMYQDGARKTTQEKIQSLRSELAGLSQQPEQVDEAGVVIPNDIEKRRKKIQRDLERAEFRLTTLNMQTVDDDFYSSLFTEEELQEIDVWMAWNQFVVEQKYQFLTLTELFQVPESQQKSEMTYFRGRVSDGNLLFDVNPVRRNKSDVMYELWQIQNQPELPSTSGGSSDIQLDEKCGSYEGVEIWEWPGAVMCWLEDLKNFEIIDTKRFSQSWKESFEQFSNDLENFQRNVEDYPAKYEEDSLESFGIEGTSERVSQQNFVEEEEVVKVQVPEKLTVFEGEEMKVVFPIRLFVNSQRLLRGFAEIDVDLPFGLQTDAVDINSEKAGLQIAVVDGAVDLQLFATKNVKDRLEVRFGDLLAHTQVFTTDELKLAVNISDIETQDNFHSATINIHSEPKFYGALPIHITTNSQSYFPTSSTILNDGSGSFPVVFQSSSDDIAFSISTDVSPAQTFYLPAQKGKAQKFVTDRDGYIVQSGRMQNIEVKIVDQFLNLIEENQEFTMFVTPLSGDYTPFKSQKIQAINGKVSIPLSTLNVHGDVHLAFMAPGMETKLLTVYTRNIIQPEQITNSSGVFTFFAQEGGDDATDLIQSMLASGSMAVAHKAPMVNIGDRDFELFPEGGFHLLEEEYLVEERKPLEFTLKNARTLEDRLTWKMQLASTPIISVTDKDADIFVETLYSQVQVSEAENGTIEISFGDSAFAKIEDGNIQLLDNRVTRDMYGTREGVVFEFSLETIPLLKVQLKGESVEVVSQTPGFTDTQEGGLILSQSSGASLTHYDGVGWQGSDTSILEMAARMPLGEAFQTSQSISDTFWGDPVLSFALTQDDVNLSGFDSTVGKRIFESTDNLSTLKSFDFNNDQITDLLVQKGSDTLVLLEGQSNGDFIERGEYGVAAEGISQIEVGDFGGDGFEDILVASNNGTVYYFNNIEGHIYPDLQAFTTDAREVESMAVADADGDEIFDVLFSTSRGEIVVHYGNTQGFDQEPSIIADFGISILSENAIEDVRVTRSDLQENFIVSLAGQAMEVTARGDTNGDGIEDIKLVPSGATRPIEIAAGYSVMPTNGRTSVIALGQSDGRFKYDNIFIQNNRGNFLYAQQINIPETIQLEVLNGMKKTTEKLPLKPAVDGQKFYTSLDRNALDIHSIVQVHLRVPSVGADEYIVDAVPPMFQFIAGSALCDGKACEAKKLQGSESAQVVFGSFDASGAKEVVYNLQLKQTPRIPFIWNKDNRQIDVPLLQKSYSTDQSRIWQESTFVRTETPALFEPNTPDLNHAANSALHRAWGMYKDNSGKATWQPSLEEKLSSAIDFLEGLNCRSGSCLNLPINKAFLVPGVWGIAPSLTNMASGDGMFSGIASSVNEVLPRIGLPLAPNLNPTPIFGVSLKQCPGPVPPIPQPCTGAACFYPSPCVNVPSPTDFRMYLSPTLTGGLAMAICKGPANITALQAAVTASMTPAAGVQSLNPTIGKCMAFALPVSDFVPMCNDINESVEDMFSQAVSSISSLTSSGKSLVQADGAVVSSSPEETENYTGITIGLKNFERFLDGDSLQNDSTYPFFKGLFTRWWDAQSSQFGKLLMLPTITFYYPNMKAVLYGGEDDMGNSVSADDALLNKWDNAWKEYNKGEEKTDTSSKTDEKKFVTKEVQPEGTLSKLEEGVKNLDENVIRPAEDFLESGRQKIEQTADTIEEEFDQVFDLVENIPFLVVDREVIDIKIPWMNPQELDSVIRELETWLEENEKEIDRVVDAIDRIIEKCKTGVGLEESDALFGQDLRVCNKAIGLTLPIDLRNLIQSVKDNLKALKEYRDFPRQLAKYKSQLAYYFVDALRYVNSLIDVLGGWLARNQAIADKYVLLWYTIKEIIASWESITLIFEDFQKSCNSCKADVYSQNFSLYDIVLGFIPTPPIIIFPRWPDIILDMSHIQAGVHIVLPELKFHIEEVNLEFDLEPIHLPDLDFLLDLDINIGINIPALPVLPPLPHLPDLPEFPALPLPRLPDLPPPPKLPSLLNCVQQFADLIRMLLRLYCLVISGLWVYPESELTRVVESLTNRPSGFMLPIDFMQLQWPDISYPWVDVIRVDGYLSVQPELDLLVEPVKEIAEDVNDFSTQTVRGIGDSVSSVLNGVSTFINEAVQPINEASDKIDDKGWEIRKNIDLDIDLQSQNFRNVPELKQLHLLADALESAFEQSRKDAIILDNTSNVYAVQTTQSDTILVAGEDASITVGLDGYERSSEQYIQEIRSQQAQAEKLIQGLYIVDEQTGQTHSLLDDIDRATQIDSTIFVDFDKDGDEDVFYTLGTKIFLKEFFEIDSQVGQLNAQPVVIQKLHDFLPEKRAVNGIKVTSQNNSVDIAWQEEEDGNASGYILERKKFVFGFDEQNRTLSDYIILLKSDLYQSSQDILGAAKVQLGQNELSLKKGETAKVLPFEETRYQWDMPNDFYYLRMFAITHEGSISTQSQQMLLSPQQARDNRPPLLLENQISRVPVLKSSQLQIFAEDESFIQYMWDIDKDGTIDFQGETIQLPAQEDIGVMEIDVTLKDTAQNIFQFEKQVEVFSPDIVIDSATQNSITGHIDPTIDAMPFALLRKRDGRLSLLQEGDERYYTDRNGNFVIEFADTQAGFQVRDSLGDAIAFVSRETGTIDMINDQYKYQALPATEDHPTQILILSDNDAVAARVSYTIQNTDPVTIIGKREASEDISVQDENISDALEVVSIPAQAKYFAGGAALLGTSNEVIAAVSPQGSIRLLSSDLQLKADQSSGTMQFVIQTRSGQDVMRVNMNGAEVENSENIFEEVSSILIQKAFAEEEFVNAEKEEKDLENPFTDLNTAHPFYQAIIDLYNRNILKGYDDGSFQADAKISRAEFVKVALGASNCFDCASPTEETKQMFQDQKPFPDVNLTDWFYYCISIAKKELMVTGYGDGQFHPQKNISRKEAVAVLLRQAGVVLEEMPEGAYTDVPEYDWAKDYVHTAVNMGLVQSIGGFTFPNQEITRGEFAMMASRILEIRDCRILPDYEDTHDTLVGKLPEELEDLQPIDTRTLADGTQIFEYPDGTFEVQYPNGERVKTDKEGVPIDPDKQEKPEEESKDPSPVFGGICPTFKGGLCPVFQENFDAPTGVFAEAPTGGLFPDLNFPNAPNISCVFVDSSQKLLPGDIISAIILSTDNTKVFSKSNEVKIPE